MSTGKNIKGKDLCVFVRFGGTNLKKQKGYSSSDDVTYHAPPAPRGIYAMPKVAQEFFLVGNIGHFQKKGNMPRDPREGDVPEGFDWDKYYERCRDARNSMRKEFDKREGMIWHHLGEYCKVSDIHDRHGSWVKTTIDAWKKAFSKMSIKLRYGNDFFAAKSINETRGIIGCYSMDHCEVFFDEKV